MKGHPVVYSKGENETQMLIKMLDRNTNLLPPFSLVDSKLH